MNSYDLFKENKRKLLPINQRLSALDEPTISERTLFLVIDAKFAELMREIEARCNPPKPTIDTSDSKYDPE